MVAKESRRTQEKKFGAAIYFVQTTHRLCYLTTSNTNLSKVNSQNWILIRGSSGYAQSMVSSRAWPKQDKNREETKDIMKAEGGENRVYLLEIAWMDG